jgi:PAS domain S-box-containing protein
MKLDNVNYEQPSEPGTRSEEERQKLLSKYEAILAAIPNIVMEVDADEVCIWANKAGLEFFGKDVLGKKASFISGADRSPQSKFEPPFGGDEDVVYAENWQRRRDCEKRLLAWWRRVLKDVNGNVTGALLTAWDITNLRKLEKRIQRKTELLEKTVESLPHPLYVIDADDYKIKMANSATSVYGPISDDTTCYALTHKVDQPCQGREHTCPLQEVKEKKKPVILEHIHYDKDGNARIIEVHGYPVFDDEGNVIQMVEYAIDITERKRLLDVLKESEERFRLVADSATDAIISSDSHGKIIFWNKAAETIFGYPADEVLGESLTLIIPERFREKHRKGMDRVVTTGKTKILGKTVELMALRKDGHEFPVELSLSRWRTGEGVFFTGIIRDITERKNAENELRAANTRMRHDLELATKVQKSLLPKEFVEIQGVRFASAYKPCDDLGGDIFNFFRLDDKHMGIYLLDVSGHGVQASLLSVTLSRFLTPNSGHISILKQHKAHSPGYSLVPPADVAEELNREFPMNPETLQFFTLIYGILDLENYEFRFICAGHNGPIHIPYDSEPVVREHPGFPIGFIKEASYKERTVSLKSGDRLYLYSDGILEAANSEAEQFGKERIIDTLSNTRKLPLRDSISSLVKEVDGWLGDVRQQDDISVLAVEITGKTIV